MAAFACSRSAAFACTSSSSSSPSSSVDRRLSHRVAASTFNSFTGLALSQPLTNTTPATCKLAKPGQSRLAVTCGLGDYFGADLLGLNLGTWFDDVENFGAVGFYAPPEGGAEGRYATILKNKGYHLMNISARGLGDLEAYLTKVHGVRPPHLGKQKIVSWYLPPEIDYRLSILNPERKGIVLWIGEAKVLSKAELQFLALLPAMRPKVKVVCEMGGARKFGYKPLKDICGLPKVAAEVAVIEDRPELELAVLEKELELVSKD